MPWEQGDAGRSVTLQALPALKFDQTEILCRAGERLSLTLDNRDDMPHNWVLIAGGATGRIGALADEMVPSPDAFSRHYVPDSPDLLCHTRIVEARRRSTIHFNAPRQPGRYPYLCTLPGHWAVMRGVLIVE